MSDTLLESLARAAASDDGCSPFVHDRELMQEAIDEINSLRKQLAAFYRIQTQGMNVSINKLQNVAQGQE